MRAFTEPLQELEEFQKIQQALKKQSIQVTGCIDAQKAHFIYAAGAAKKKLIVTYSELRAKELCENYRLFDKNVLFYPAKDLIFYSADVHGQAIAKERLKVVKALSEQKNLTVITTIDAGMDHCFSFEKYEKQKIEITPDKEFDLEQLQKQLSAMGYEKAAQVEQEGEFSVRASLASAEKQLAQYHFSRCNQCYLVNLKYVKAVENDFVHVNTDHLEISRRQRAAFLTAVASYIGGVL